MRLEDIQKTLALIAEWKAGEGRGLPPVRVRIDGDSVALAEYNIAMVPFLEGRGFAVRAGEVRRIP